MGERLLHAVDWGLDRLWPEQALEGVAPAEIDWWQRSARRLFFLLLLAALPIAIGRVANHSSASDFPAFYASAQYLLVHGERRCNSEFMRYLPSADLPWIALALLPLPAAAVVYYLFNCWCWMGLLDTIGRNLLTGVALAQRRQIMLQTGLLVMPLALDGFAVGAFHVFMVWMMVAGLCQISRERTWQGGFVLGLAIWVKLLPALGAAYLIFKRKWQPAVIALAAVLAADVVLSVASYGPREAWRHHAVWWRDEGSGALNRQLTNPDAINEDRITNQSIAVVLRHTLTTFGMDFSDVRKSVSIADVSAGTLRVVYLTIVGLLALAGAYYCRRSWPDTSRRQRSAEIALLLLATLWFSPVVWGYHPTAVTPALALVISRAPQYPRLCRGMALVWLAALALFAVPYARLLGHATLASLLLGAAVIWVSRPPHCRDSAADA